MPKTSPEAPDGGRKFTFHDLIIFAVEGLDGGRKGSSVQAIKKYILTQYGVEVSAKNSHHFKRGLETALEGESLIRVTGAGGVTGSFRLPSKTAKKSPPTAGNATVRTTRKKSPPTAGNATAPTTRKKSPPTNVDDVAAAMRNLAVRVTEQPGTSTGAGKTRAKGKMMADDRREVPATRKPVVKAAVARAPTSPFPSSSKGKNKNPQPAAAATSRPAAVRTKPATAQPTAAKAPATSRPTATKTKPAPPIITKAAAKSGTSVADEKATRGKIVQKPEAAIGRTRATKNTTAPSSALSGAVIGGKQKKKTQLSKSNGPPLKTPAKTAITIQKKAKAKALVLSEESEEDEEPEEEDIVDGNNNSTVESVKEDDKDSEEDPDASEFENESNGTLIPPPSSSASHRSTNNVSDSEESTDGEQVHNETSSSSHRSSNDVGSEESTDGEEMHNETGGSATNMSVFDENPSSLDLSRQSHDRTTKSAMDMGGGSDQMNSLTVEAPSSRDSNMTSSTTNTQVRQDGIKNEVVNESILDESQGDTTTYDEEIEESDVSQIEATKYVPRANQYSTQSEDELEQETDDEGSTAIKTDTEDEVATEDEEVTEDEVAIKDEAVTEDEVATEDDDTKDEDAMELTDDEDEEYDVSRTEATSYVRDERDAVGNEEVTQIVPGSDDDESEEEESEDEESENEESEVDESENGEAEEEDEGDDEEENSDEEE